MSVHHLKISNSRWERLRRQVFAHDGYRCRSCKAAGRLEADHIVPLHKGGAVYDIRNLQTLCRDCHIKKTADENSPTSPERREWSAYLRSL